MNVPMVTPEFRMETLDILETMKKNKHRQPTKDEVTALLAGFNAEHRVQYLRGRFLHQHKGKSVRRHPMWTQDKLRELMRVSYLRRLRECYLYYSTQAALASIALAGEQASASIGVMSDALTKLRVGLKLMPFQEDAVKQLQSRKVVHPNV